MNNPDLCPQGIIQVISGQNHYFIILSSGNSEDYGDNKELAIQKYNTNFPNCSVPSGWSLQNIGLIIPYGIIVTLIIIFITILLSIFFFGISLEILKILFRVRN